MTRLFAAALWIAVPAALFIANLTPSLIPGDVDDKLLHVLAFTALALLVACAYPKVSLRKLWLWLTAFAAVIELAQLALNNGREGGWIDLLVGAAAAAAVFVGVFLVRQFRTAPSA